MIKNIKIMNELILTKESSSEEIKKYFEKILDLSKSTENEFPVNLDEVWMLAYNRKDYATDALVRDFIEDVDYQRTSARTEVGSIKYEYKISVPCLEFFIARKIRPVFEVYRKVFHGVARMSFSNKVPTTFSEALRLAAEQQEQKNKKISDSLKGHAVSIETKRKISESLRRKMSTKDESLKGLRNGRLIILEEIERKVKPSGQKERMVKCLCDCGKAVEVRLNNFIHGRVKSCGCLQREIASNVARKHGLSLTKINNVYRAIKRRCYNKNCDDYKDYGGRGIKMCKEWKDDFTSFYNWAISNGYDPNKTMKEQSIDRIDVNGYYEPSNCRIVKWVVQARNRRTTKRYLYMGEFLDLKTISERSGINYHTLWQRINKYGYTFNDALF